VSGAPISGATLNFGSYSTVTTGADGSWTLRSSSSAFGRLAATIEAPGYLRRETGVTWNSAGRNDIRLDLIPDAAPFSLSFYRQIARNGFQTSSGLEPIRRWTKAPNFYVNTSNPRTGGSLRPSEIDLIQQVIRGSVPQLTGGVYGAGAIEFGSEARERRLDYINISIVYEPESNSCGRALVGSNPGEIWLNFERCNSRCGGFSPEVLAHEIGHAMGLWHTEARGIMYAFEDANCNRTEFSADERLHAKIMYGRPVGNRDADLDPTSFAAVQADTGAPIIICER
jgi:hypothetical protein